MKKIEQPHSWSTLILCSEGHSRTAENRDSHNYIGLQYASAKEHAMIWIFKCFGFLSSAATVLLSESWKNSVILAFSWHQNLNVNENLPYNKPWNAVDELWVERGKCQCSYWF